MSNIQTNYVIHEEIILLEHKTFVRSTILPIEYPSENDARSAISEFGQYSTDYIVLPIIRKKL